MSDPAPDPAPGVVTCLVVRDPEAAARFYADAFDARELARGAAAAGAPASIQIAIGAVSMLLVPADRAGGMLGPDSYGGAPVRFIITSADPAATVERARRHGAVLLSAANDRHAGILRDPFLHVWHVSGRQQGASAGAPPRSPDLGTGS
jgi:PhnB protein